MQVVETTQCLSEDPLKSLLCVKICSVSHAFDKWSDCTVHQLNKDPKNAPIIIVSIDDVQAEPTATHAHKSHLVNHEFTIFFITWSAEFQSKLLLVSLPEHLVNLGKAANSELVLAKDIVERRWVTLLPDVVL